MNDPVVSQFAEACGAKSPLHLRVDLVEGGRRAEGTVSMPYTLVGRDDACDVTLTDPEVNPRHAWLQVLGGRVLAVDLGSRTGLGWPGRGTGSGWLDVGVPLRIGPFELSLCSAPSPRPVRFPPRYSPLQSDPAILGSEATYGLEFRNGRRARDRWTVNRLVTLVGRAPECKIRLTAEDIAAHHCGLVLTPTGLWVVDLSGRGVVVNGERMRVAPLAHGAELWVGRFLIGLHRRPGPPGPAYGRAAAQPARPQPPAPPRYAEPAEDEVPLGVVPPQDPQAGLPSSHIMADAFRSWGAAPGGGVSNPILVSSSGPAPLARPVVVGTAPAPPDPAPSERGAGPRPVPSGPPLLDAPSAATVTALLREMGELHGQMLTQFEQSLGLMVRLFACLGPEQLPAMQQELARIQELNSELGKLQTELARRATQAPPAPPPHPPAVAPAPTSTDSTALHDWVADRINTLQKERQARWQSLVGMFSAAEGRRP